MTRGRANKRERENPPPGQQSKYGSGIKKAQKLGLAKVRGAHYDRAILDEVQDFMPNFSAQDLIDKRNAQQAAKEQEQIELYWEMAKRRDHETDHQQQANHHMKTALSHGKVLHAGDSFEFTTELTTEFTTTVHADLVGRLDADGVVRYPNSVFPPARPSSPGPSQKLGSQKLGSQKLGSQKLGLGTMNSMGNLGHDTACEAQYDMKRGVYTACNCGLRKLTVDAFKEPDLVQPLYALPHLTGDELGVLETALALYVNEVAEEIKRLEDQGRPVEKSKSAIRTGVSLMTAIAEARYHHADSAPLIREEPDE